MGFFFNNKKKEEKQQQETAQKQARDAELELNQYQRIEGLAERDKVETDEQIYIVEKRVVDADGNASVITGGATERYQAQQAGKKTEVKKAAHDNKQTRQEKGAYMVNPTDLIQQLREGGAPKHTGKPAAKPAAAKPTAAKKPASAAKKPAAKKPAAAKPAAKPAGKTKK